ncbi:anthranilate synthase component I [Actinopolymorpha sp. B11F2]|uniref:anthranilate synthase component I n=1 Tax=Actinopolymorpha sp. B11F2 TaxID=3160862 RepID=UPI0032E3FEC3
MDDTTCYRTAGGIAVTRTTSRADRMDLADRADPNHPVDPTDRADPVDRDGRVDRPDRTDYAERGIRDQLEEFASGVETRRGGILSSGIDYPGRYSRWHLGYVDPPLEIAARGRRITATALNARGEVLLSAVAAVMSRTGEVVATAADHLEVEVPAAAGDAFAEEERSRQPTVFTTLRAIVALFSYDGDHQLGLYGAYGYDLAHQFEPLRLVHDRGTTAHRDLVLHLPDEILVVDRKRETSVRYAYDFIVDGVSTAGLPRHTEPTPVVRSQDVPPAPVPGRYAQIVRDAKERFFRGDLFEVTPSHVVHGPCASPAAFYSRLRERNPAPYEFFFNLGEGEYLVGASPEMYVRVTGSRVETCPIAGTIRRGADPLEDAEQIRTLLNSTKDEAELTMCTDVDRNDKSRVCVPGSVRVIGRRQIELYSRLIHTVDHIEGTLRPGLDAFDAFLTHMWAVTVTGAPKQWAMQFIEDHEDAPRRWYGGAIGVAGFDGSMNTGLMLRTAHISSGVASVRVGATLLYDSDPEEEERETHLKAQALLDALATPGDVDRGAAEAPSGGSGSGGAGSGSAGSGGVAPAAVESLPGNGMRVLVVDHQDSFVHTLGDYFRQQGAGVTTLRYGFAEAMLDELAPDLVVLSPGPGRPTDFDCASLLRALDARGLPAFGVCLGLQAMVEYDGGALDLLPYPAHGKPAEVHVLGGELLAGMGASFTAGRYHSLFATPDQVRATAVRGGAGGGFAVTATTAEQAGSGGTAAVAMAIEDPVRRRWAVQFHPESILTATGRAGHQVVGNVLTLCRSRATITVI